MLDDTHLEMIDAHAAGKLQQWATEETKPHSHYWIEPTALPNSFPPVVPFDGAKLSFST